MVIDVYTAKNKVSPPYKHIKLTYLDGEGFSPIFDMFTEAITSKIIEKSGSWFSFKGERLGQGEEKAYQLVKSNPDLLKKIAEAMTKE